MKNLKCDENAKKHNKRRRMERFVALLLALTSFGSYNMGYTAHSVRPNRLTPTSYSPKPSGCVKTHVCMKNKPYTAFKSKNKIKNSQFLGGFTQSGDVRNC